jgi:hypothetical protein
MESGCARMLAPGCSHRIARAEVRVTSVRTVITDGHVDVALGSQ